MKNVPFSELGCTRFDAIWRRGWLRPSLAFDSRLVERILLYRDRSTRLADFESNCRDPSSNACAARCADTMTRASLPFHLIPTIRAPKKDSFEGHPRRSAFFLCYGCRRWPPRFRCWPADTRRTARPATAALGQVCSPPTPNNQRRWLRQRGPCDRHAGRLKAKSVGRRNDVLPQWPYTNQLSYCARNGLARR